MKRFSETSHLSCLSIINCSHATTFFISVGIKSCSTQMSQWTFHLTFYTYGHARSSFFYVKERTRRFISWFTFVIPTTTCTRAYSDL
jgi:hypothetical protein